MPAGGYIGGENLDAFIAELDERFAKTSDLKIEKISGLQEALDGKQAEITGGASSVVSANLSSGRVLISDTAGKIAVSTITLQNLKALWERYNRLPAGVIFPWGGKIANKPSWSLLCDGSEVLRTQFAGLFDAIGTTWGEGDGSTTFNLPDLDERFIEGTVDTSKVGEYVEAGLPDITGSHFQKGWKSSVPVTSGALTGEIGTEWVGGQTSAGGKAYGVSLKASLSSNLFGRSATVQPRAGSFLMCVKI